LVSFEKQGHNGVFLRWVLSPLKTLGTLHGPLNLLLKGQTTLHPKQPESTTTIPCVFLGKRRNQLFMKGA